MTMTDDGWVDPSFTGEFARWAEPGDSVTGLLVAYDPEGGAMNFDRTAEVPCARILTEDGPLLVALDRPNLRRAWEAAMRRAEQQGLWGAGSELRLQMYAQFTGWAESGRHRYKSFRVLYREAPAEFLESLPADQKTEQIDDMEEPW